MLFSLEADPSILPCYIFSNGIHCIEFDDLCMRIRRYHAIALSLVRYGQGHERGIDRPVRVDVRAVVS